MQRKPPQGSDSRDANRMEILTMLVTDTNPKCEADTKSRNRNRHRTRTRTRSSNRTENEHDDVDCHERCDTVALDTTSPPLGDTKVVVRAVLPCLACASLLLFLAVGDRPNPPNYVSLHGNVASPWASFSELFRLELLCVCCNTPMPESAIAIQRTVEVSLSASPSSTSDRSRSRSRSSSGCMMDVLEQLHKRNLELDKRNLELDKRNAHLQNGFCRVDDELSLLRAKLCTLHGELSCAKARGIVAQSRIDGLQSELTCVGTRANAAISNLQGELARIKQREHAMARTLMNTSF